MTTISVISSSGKALPVGRLARAIGSPQEELAGAEGVGHHDAHGGAAARTADFLHHLGVPVSGEAQAA